VKESISATDLAPEAQKFLYRVSILEGPTTAKRNGEHTTDTRQVKRPRRDVIELSSEEEENTHVLSNQRPAAMDPQSIFSSESEHGGESSGEYGDLSFDEDDLVLESEFRQHVAPSGSNTQDTSVDKGKGKEVELPLDLQDELECFICCISPAIQANHSNVDGCTVHLFSMRSRCLWSLQYVFLFC
jgi:hypothetical protein